MDTTPKPCAVFFLVEGKAQKGVVLGRCEGPVGCPQKSILGFVSEDLFLLDGFTGKALKFRSLPTEVADFV